MSTPDRGALERALVALARARVDFVVVGMFGINLHATRAEERFVTEDLDVLLEPSVATLAGALRALADEGFSFEAGGEPFVDLSDEAALASVIRAGATLRAVHDGQVTVDLMLSMANFAHEDVAREANRFRIHGIEFRVGSLEMLLESKRTSARPKDLRFLEHYEAAQRRPAPVSRRKRKPSRAKARKK